MGYFRESTIHGLRYVVGNRSLVAKAAWLVCILVSAATAIGLIVGNIANWTTQPAVVTGVGFDLVQVRKPLTWSFVSLLIDTYDRCGVRESPGCPPSWSAPTLSTPM